MTAVITALTSLESFLAAAMWPWCWYHFGFISKNAPFCRERARSFWRHCEPCTFLERERERERARERKRERERQREKEEYRHASMQSDIQAESKIDPKP